MRHLSKKQARKLHPGVNRATVAAPCAVISPGQQWPGASDDTTGERFMNQPTTDPTSAAHAHPDRLDRRRFLVASGGALAGGLLLRPGRAAAAPPEPAPSPFTLGVASGDPLPDSVVLWTRLAPDPLHGGGVGGRRVPVQWEIAEDETMRRVVGRGTEVAVPEQAHSVHAEVRGLAPDRVYFYRFKAGPDLSPVGRTRTAPAAGSSPGNLRFGFASCQNWQDGYFPALHHLAQEDLAFVAFLGDYIYESPARYTALRAHESEREPVTLDEYRNRYAQYRTDPNLQAAHAAAAWIVTLDDHELDNNWADDVPQDPASQSPASFRARRAAAFQAYYEHMPLRAAARPVGTDMQLYRRFDFGDLVRLHVLDTRQYRSDQVRTKEEAAAPGRSMTGDAQEAWLLDGLTESPARWNVLAQQTMMAQNDRMAGPGEEFDFDNWDGYRYQRARLMEFFGSGATTNPVVVTGDRHATWVCDLKANFDDPDSATVGAELTGTSIASGGDSNRVAFHARYDPIMAESPHWKFIDVQRGYFVCDLTPERMESSLRVVDTVLRPEGTTVSTFARFQTVDGQPGVHVM